MQIRDAQAGEVDPLARLWLGAWHDAHALIVPPALTRIRTLEDFTTRLCAALELYEKHGWRRAGVFVHHPETPDGKLTMEAWRYEKRLR